MKGNSDGILLSFTSEGFHTVNDVTIGPVDSRGIRIESDNNNVSNNTIIEPEEIGVFIPGNNRNIIEGNTIIMQEVKGPGLIGINIQDNLNRDPGSDNQILNNSIFGGGFLGAKGVSLDVAVRNVIKGNTINDANGFGISINNANDNQIQDNIVNNVNVDECGQGGIGITINGNGNTVDDNTVTRSESNGIVVESGSTGTVVTGNTLAGNGDDSTDNILDLGIGTTVEGNVETTVSGHKICSIVC